MIKKWYEIVAHFIKGYHELNPLLDIEMKSISCLMKNIEILFIAYFLKEEDEALAENAASLYRFVQMNEETIQEAVLRYASES